MRTKSIPHGICVRIDDRTKIKLDRKFKKFGDRSSALRELIVAYLDNRVVIKQRGEK